MSKMLSIDHCVQCKHGTVVVADVRSRVRLMQTCSKPGSEHNVDGCVHSGISSRCKLPDDPAWPTIPSTDTERDEPFAVGAPGPCHECGKVHTPGGTCEP